MQGNPLVTADSLERQIELAFRSGAFIHDRMCASFVSGLEEVAAQIEKLANADPGCYERAGLAAEWEATVRQVRWGKRYGREHP